VYTLGAQTFTTAGTDGPTLKDILEDPDIPKVFFDVRNDSDALFAHYGIALQSVEDVQLMESATRRDMYLRKHLSGLAKYMEKNITVGNLRRYTAWLDNKIAGEKLFKAEHGGSYEVFNKRPLPEDIIAYCAGDVQCLPELRNKFWGTRSQEWRDLVREETKRRVASTHMPDYRPYGKDKALAPWNDEQNKVLDRLYWAPRFEDYTDDDDDYDEFSNAADDGDDYY
jgi:exonuclease 3'-5' domain-containing protein 1